jgi:hypothetical protein
MEPMFVVVPIQASKETLMELMFVVTPIQASKRTLMELMFVVVVHKDGQDKNWLQ